MFLQYQLYIYLPAIAPNYSSCRTPSVANAHAVFAKQCGLNSSSLTNALPATFRLPTLNMPITVQIFWRTTNAPTAVLLPG